MTNTTTAAHLAPGMMIKLSDDQIYRVDAAVRVALAKGVAVIKVTLKHVASGDIAERNFKPEQEVEEVKLAEKKFEYLYADQGKHLFLDIQELDLLHVQPQVIGEKVNYLKEGIEVVAHLYDDLIYSVELPQFLELMVVKVEEKRQNASASITQHENMALLETGMRVGVPSYVGSGDVIKVDTLTDQFVQRV